MLKYFSFDSILFSKYYLKSIRIRKYFFLFLNKHSNQHFYSKVKGFSFIQQMQTWSYEQWFKYRVKHKKKAGKH